MRSRTRSRWLLAITVTALVGAACAGDDADDTEAFCDQVRELEASGDTEEDLAVAAEQFATLVDAAPEDLRGDLQVVADAFSELSALDEDDPESFALIFEIFARPEVIEASENLEEYGVEECGLEPSDLDDEGEAIDLGTDPESEGSDEGAVAEVEDRYDGEPGASTGV